MTRQQFQAGLKVFFSCGGPNVDEKTLEVWYRMLANLHPEDFEKAILGICQEIKELGRINFIAEVKERSATHRRSRESELARNARMLPPKDAIPFDKLQKLCKEFTNSLKEIPEAGND